MLSYLGEHYRGVSGTLITLRSHGEGWISTKWLQGGVLYTIVMVVFGPVGVQGVFRSLLVTYRCLFRSAARKPFIYINVHHPWWMCAPY